MVSTSVMRWHLPQPLAREVVVRAGSHAAVVAGGLIAGDVSTARSYRLDVTTGRWSPLPALSVPVHDAAGADLAGLPIVLGGGNASEQAGVQRLQGGGWRVVSHLPTARSDLSALTVGGRLLVFGGYDGIQSQPEILSSADGRSFTPIGRLPVPVRYAAVATVAGSVWVLGGESNGRMLDAVQRIDPRTGGAKLVARLPRPLGDAVAVPVAGRILVAGGRTGPDTLTAKMWWFDPSTLRFRAAGRLPMPLADAGVLPTHKGADLLGGETPALSGRIIRIVVR
jgi:N-acetylneuraminic acid mutarotase